MSKMFASDPGCRFVTVDRSGRRYDADRAGFIHVDDSTDIRLLKAGGYVEASNQPATKRKWVCQDCGWEALINSCPRCHTNNLVRVAE